MLTQLLYGLPLFLFLVFGLLHVTELGYLVGATEQATFFGARNQFVQKDLRDGVAYVSDLALFAPDRMTARLEATENEENAIVEHPYPNLLPFAVCLLGQEVPNCDPDTSLESVGLPHLRATQPIPPRFP